MRPPLFALLGIFVVLADSVAASAPPNGERWAAEGMKFTQAYADAVRSPTRVSAVTDQAPRAVRAVPESALARALVWQGVAIQEDHYTVWCASPIFAEGRFHLFAARWPEANVDPAWRKSSEIAHYVAERPEGPFRFRAVVLRGTGRAGDWDAFAPHNPEIQGFG